MPFSKEEQVAFEDILAGFEDALVLSREVTKYNRDAVSAERSNDTIWRPQPYILQTFDGRDQTGNFNDQTQLSVPATVQNDKSAPWLMDANQLRDALQENRLGQAAYQKLASDVNQSVNLVASQQGTIVVDFSTAASGYDDIATVETRLDELGIPMYDRKIGVAAKDYQGLAKDLANRSTMNTLPTNAYERSLVPNVANFDLMRMDTFKNVPAAAGTVAIAGASQYYTPVATQTNAINGGESNVDNRYQSITVDTTASVVVGDAFTIAGVNSVHHITKEDTGQLKTFRVIEVVNGTTLKISPAIVSAEGATNAEEQYKNVTATPANLAALTFLNTTVAPANPFWHKDAIELMPSRYAVPTDTGLDVMTSTLENGMEVVFMKSTNIDDVKTKFRVSVRYGVNMLQPEMAGIAIFGQV